MQLASAMIGELAQIESLEHELLMLKFSILEEFVTTHTNEYGTEKSGNLHLASDRFKDQVAYEVSFRKGLRKGLKKEVSEDDEHDASTRGSKDGKSALQ